MEIIRGFLSILGSKVATLLVGLITTPILVRLLGSSQYGDYAFLLSILGMAMIIINAGTFDGVRKYISEDREDPHWTENVIGFYFRLSFILAITGALFFILFSWTELSVRLFGDRFKIYFYFLAILAVCRQINSITRGSLMGLGLENRSEPLNGLKSVLVAIIGLYLVHSGYGIVGVLLGHIVSAAIVSILGFAVLVKHINFSLAFTRICNSVSKAELLSFNALSILLIFLTASLYHVDILFLRFLSGDQATGYYKAALVIAEFLWFVPNVLQMVLLDSSSELWSNNRVERITNLASQTTKYNISLTLLLMIGLAALVHDFIPMYYGPEFDAAILPLLLLLPGVLGFALARPIFAIGQGKGQLQILVFATGAASLINVVLNALLIPNYGMIGAAIATSTGYGSMLALHILAARRIGFNPLKNLPIMRIMVVGFLAATMIFGLSSAIDSSTASLIFIPPIGFIIYSILSLRLSVISIEETKLLTRHLPDPVKSYLEKSIYFVS